MPRRVRNDRRRPSVVPDAVTARSSLGTALGPLMREPLPQKIADLLARLDAENAASPPKESAPPRPQESDS